MEDPVAHSARSGVVALTGRADGRCRTAPQQPALTELSAHVTF